MLFSKKVISIFLTMSLASAIGQARLPDETADYSSNRDEQTSGRYVISDKDTGHFCYIPSSLKGEPSFRGAEMVSEENNAALQGSDPAMSVSSLTDIPRCSSSEKQEFSAALTSLEKGSKTAGLPFWVGYYLVCTAVNAGAMWANTAGSGTDTLGHFIVLSGASLTICGPVTGANFAIYYLGKATIEALTGKSENSNN